MKHTLKKLYACLAAMLLAVFCTFSSTQEAYAKQPDCMKTTYSRPTLHIIGQDINKPGYLGLRVVVTHKNISKNGEVVRAIFDKKLRMTYNFFFLYADKTPISRTVTSSKVTKVELYPGQSIDLSYMIPIDNKGKISWVWGKVNKDILEDYRSDRNRLYKYIKDRKYYYDFQVRTIK